MSKFTAKVVTLYGDKTRATEAAQHIINFPGGSVEVSRHSDGSYWAHIARNRNRRRDQEGGRAGGANMLDRKSLLISSGFTILIVGLVESLRCYPAPDGGIARWWAIVALVLIVSAYALVLRER